MTALIFVDAAADNGAITIFLPPDWRADNSSTHQSSWLGRPDSAMAWMIGVGSIVCCRSTSYTLGRAEVIRGAVRGGRIDGASGGAGTGRSRCRCSGRPS